MTFLKVFSFSFLVKPERNPCVSVSHVLSAGSGAKRWYSIRSSVAEKEGQNFSHLALFAGVSHGRLVPARAMPPRFRWHFIRSKIAHSTATEHSSVNESIRFRLASPMDADSRSLSVPRVAFLLLRRWSKYRDSLTILLYCFKRTATAYPHISMSYPQFHYWMHIDTPTLSCANISSYSRCEVHHAGYGPARSGAR
jgi:hypothetical protein